MNIEIPQGYDHYHSPSAARLGLYFKRKMMHYKNIKILLNKLSHLIDKSSWDIFFTTSAVTIIENYVNEALCDSCKNIQDSDLIDVSYRRPKIQISNILLSSISLSLG